MSEKNKTLPLAEGAVTIALSVVLSFVVIFKLPWGGSVTLLSMLPLSLYSIKHGIIKGAAAAFVFSVFQLGMGLADGLLGWGLTPVMLVGCILLDYILAYSVLGIAGIFRKKGSKGRLGGIILALAGRFACHLLSGVVIFHSAGVLWNGISTDNELLYSLIYNASYMLPEMIFTFIGAFVLFKVPVIEKYILPVKNTQ